MNANYLFIKTAAGVLATIGLYSVLYRENKLYRFFEHVFLGLAVGWTLVSTWTTQLHDDWYAPIVGSSPEKAGDTATPGLWAYALLLPIGLMAYFVFNKKHNWLSRIPIGIIIGLWSGQQIQVWWNRYGPQFGDSMKPIR